MFSQLAIWGDGQVVYMCCMRWRASLPEVSVWYLLVLLWWCFAFCVQKHTSAAMYSNAAAHLPVS
jgi:hypothetical protein